MDSGDNGQRGLHNALANVKRQQNKSNDKQCSTHIAIVSHSSVSKNTMSIV